jgi:hypothetical protein
MLLPMLLSCRYDDGGMLKVTYSTAFTVSLLSWAFLQFKEGYRASGNLDLSANTVRWGSLVLDTNAASAMLVVLEQQQCKSLSATPSRVRNETGPQETWT